MNYAEIMGWLGAVLYILAYLLLTLRKISAKKPLYHFLNIAGGVCLIVHAAKIMDIPNVIVNAIWVLIGGYAVFKFGDKSI